MGTTNRYCAATPGARRRTPRPTFFPTCSRGSPSSISDVARAPSRLTWRELVAPGQAIGLDASDDVIAQAKAYAESRGITNLRCEVGDLFSLRYDDATFDVVHAHQVLQHLVDPGAALRGIAPGAPTRWGAGCTR